MDDLIPRAAAYDVIGEMIKEYREKGEDDLADGMIIARRYGIKRLPAVDAIPVEWVRSGPKICVKAHMFGIFCGIGRRNRRRDSEIQN